MHAWPGTDPYTEHSIGSGLEILLRLSHSCLLYPLFFQVNSLLIKGPIFFMLIYFLILGNFIAAGSGIGLVFSNWYK